MILMNKTGKKNFLFKTKIFYKKIKKHLTIRKSCIIISLKIIIGKISARI